MHWLEFIVYLPREYTERAEDYLLAQGAQAITIQDRYNQEIYEPDIGTTPLWDSNRLTALFSTKLEAETLFQNLKQFLGKGVQLNQYVVQALEDRDWEREWLKHYKRMCFGERLWVIPSVTEDSASALPEPLKPDDVVLHMDPGLAFGTGTHETTALCLEWLAQTELDNKVIIDYGCGSGILAIAASLLGAKSVYACDLDPQAVLASRENSRRNQLESNIFIDDVAGFERHFRRMEQQADILVANILAGPLEQLADDFAQLVASGGMIVLSGILHEQVEAVTLSYRENFQDFQIDKKNQWARIVASRK